MVDNIRKWVYDHDMQPEEIRRTLAAVRQEKEKAANELEAATGAEKSLERMLALKEREDRPPISLRAAILQVLRESEGQPIHVKEVLEKVGALGAVVRSSSGDKVSRVDVGIYGLKKQGYPFERVGTRTWKYLGGEAIDFKKELAGKKRQRRKAIVTKEIAKDSMTGGKARE